MHLLVAAHLLAVLPQRLEVQERSQATMPHQAVTRLPLAPVQTVILPVAPSHHAYAAKLHAAMRAHGVRAEVVGSEESLGKRMRAAEMQRVPYVLVVGDQEVQRQSLAVRNVRTKKQVMVPWGEFVEKTVADIRERRLRCSVG